MMYIARFRNLAEKRSDYIRVSVLGRLGRGEYPWVAHGVPGFGSSFKSRCA